MTAPDMDAAIADVEEEIATGLGKARQSWKEAASSIHPDLQPAGYRVLSAVIHLQGASGRVLASTLCVDKSMISRQARVLERCGLIVTRCDDDDQRSRILEATPYGLARVQSVRTEQSEKLRAFLRTRSHDEVSGIAALLRLLNEGG